MQAEGQQSTNRHVQESMWPILRQFKTGIHKVCVREKATEVAETSMGLRSLAGNMEERGSQVHIKTHKHGKSAQMDLSGSQLAVGRPGRNLEQCIQQRG